MWGILLFAMLLLCGAAHAQISPPGKPLIGPTYGTIEQPFTRNIESEELAPLVVTPTAKITTTEAGKVAEGADSPFVVRGVSVTLGQTTGFARDAALDMAARKALPQVLAALPMSAEDATAKAKAVGQPLSFVSSYTIVKEVLIPTYGLVVDLTFNEQMIRTNFGGVRVSSTVVVSSTSGGLISDTVAAPVAPVKMNRFVVRVLTADPISQDKVYRALSGLQDTQAHYRVMAGAGAEFGVNTPLDESRIDAAVSGFGAVVTALPAEVVVPVSAEVSATGEVSGSIGEP